MINFNPGTVYVYNQDETAIRLADVNDCSIECECECEDEFNYISEELVRRMRMEQLRFWRN